MRDSEDCGPFRFSSAGIAAYCFRPDYGRAGVVFNDQIVYREPPATDELAESLVSRAPTVLGEDQVGFAVLRTHHPKSPRRRKREFWWKVCAVTPKAEAPAPGNRKPPVVEEKPPDPAGTVPPLAPDNSTAPAPAAPDRPKPAPDKLSARADIVPERPGPAPLGFRLKSKDLLTRRAGKDPATRAAAEGTAEAPILAGLRWLARHQKPDGSWDSDGFARACGTCGGPGYPEFDAAQTGLALTAFFGAGYTHLSRDTYDGICFGHVVKKGLQWLQANQDAEGCVGGKSGSKYMYNHSVAALAFCEAYGLTGSGLFKDNAQNSINFLIAAQNPYRGWRYTAKSGDNDSSVVGWCVMALKSAELCGLHAHRGGYEGAKAWLDEATGKDFRVGYTARDTGQVVVAGKNEHYANHEALAAIGMVCRLFIDKNRADPRLKGAADLLVRDLPVWEGPRIDYYYWYYASLALFQFDGPSGPLWTAWNASVRDALVKNQRKEPEKCLSGSWDPIDRWGFEGGRVYATALNLLTLETCYRYPVVADTSHGKAAASAPSKPLADTARLYQCPACREMLRAEPGGEGRCPYCGTLLSWPK